MAAKHWIVLPSGTLFLPKFFLHCHCVRRTDFAAKYASMIFICCGVVQHPVGSILVSKKSLWPAVYTTGKIWKKLKDTTLGWKTNSVLFLNHPVFGHKEYTLSFNLDLCFTVHCHCVKRVRIRSYSGPYFSPFSPNVGKYGPE